MEHIVRKSLLYKTKVEYGDYTINHVQGCSHGCRYPCYAFMLAKRFGRIGSYEEWRKPRIVKNSIEVLEREIPKYRERIKSVHFCFTTDPFMYGYDAVKELTLSLMSMLNDEGIKCTALTKGTLPIDLARLSTMNEVGITLVSLDERFRRQYEPYSAPIEERIRSLFQLHKKGLTTWVSIEPYPTPNIVGQEITSVLKAVSFVDKIVFGRLNYNAEVSKYPQYKQFYNDLSHQVMSYCHERNMDCHIKRGTMTV